MTCSGGYPTGEGAPLPRRPGLGGKGDLRVKLSMLISHLVIFWNKQTNKHMSICCANAQARVSVRIHDEGSSCRSRYAWR